MIFFECYADEIFLKYLGFSSKELTGGHSFGRSNVCWKLKKTTNSLGFVDEDPGAPRDEYLRYMLSLNPVFQDLYLHCSIDSKRKNKLLILKPDIEGFAIRLSSECRINLNDPKYGLTSNKKRLHDMLQTNSKKRDKFVEFVEDVSHHKAIVTLKELIKI